jgi:hypothetical protein
MMSAADGLPPARRPVALTRLHARCLIPHMMPFSVYAAVWLSLAPCSVPASPVKVTALKPDQTRHVLRPAARPLVSARLVRALLCPDLTLAEWLLSRPVARRLGLPVPPLPDL